jgi:hypothetical protein
MYFNEKEIIVLYHIKTLSKVSNFKEKMPSLVETSVKLKISYNYMDMECFNFSVSYYILSDSNSTLSINCL